MKNINKILWVIGIIAVIIIFVPKETKKEMGTWYVPCGGTDSRKIVTLVGYTDSYPVTSAATTLAQSVANNLGSSMTSMTHNKVLLTSAYGGAFKSPCSDSCNSVDIAYLYEQAGGTFDVAWVYCTAGDTIYCPATYPYMATGSSHNMPIEPGWFDWSSNSASITKNVNFIIHETLHEYGCTDTYNTACRDNCIMDGLGIGNSLDTTCCIQCREQLKLTACAVCNPPDCSDNNPCTIDVCNSTIGVCIHDTNSRPLCTMPDGSGGQCSGGVCYSRCYPLCGQFTADGKQYDYQCGDSNCAGTSCGSCPSGQECIYELIGGIHTRHCRVSGNLCYLNGGTCCGNEIDTCLGGTMVNSGCTKCCMGGTCKTSVNECSLLGGTCKTGDCYADYDFCSTSVYGWCTSGQQHCCIGQCIPPTNTQTCAQLNGLTCPSAQSCIGTIVQSSDSNACCLSRNCGTPTQSCANKGGTCKTIVCEDEGLITVGSCETGWCCKTPSQPNNPLIPGVKNEYLVVGACGLAVVIGLAKKKLIFG